jgi:hypothetical protein
MRSNVLTRGARVLAWLLGASAAGVGGCAISVYAFGNYDHAYSQLAIFQLGTALAFFFAVTGSVGYAIAIAIRGSNQSAVMATVAGLVFAVAMQCTAFSLSTFVPGEVSWPLAVSIAVFLGAASTAFQARNVA